MEQTTPIEEAQTLGSRVLFAISLPDGWREANEDYPLEEAHNPDFPDDYNPQFEVTGFTNGETYVGVWWLRGGERLQAFYDSSEEWGGVYGVDGVVTEIEGRL